MTNADAPFNYLYRVFHCLKCKNPFTCHVAVSAPSHYVCIKCGVRLEIKLVDIDSHMYQISELIHMPSWES